ncbi:MAG: sel1 repeat family protein [Roseburia sp.]|nr:sel1 repeat family protein [Roseburia sp.]
MGLFDLFAGKSEPQIPLKEYLDGCNYTNSFIRAAKSVFDVSWDYTKGLPKVSTTAKGKDCLYHFVFSNGDKLEKMYKNEIVDGFYLLERACECGSSLAALYLAVLYQHGVGRPVNGPQDIEANLQKAMKYYDKATELGEDQARLVGVFITFMQTATNFNEMAGREEALIMSAAFAASYFKGSLYDMVETQGYLKPEDKENIQWLVSLVVCWYASQGYPLCLAFVANMLYHYDAEKGYIKMGVFYDRFTYMVSRKDEAKRIVETYLQPKIKAGDKHAIAAWNFFGWVSND